MNQELAKVDPQVRVILTGYLAGKVSEENVKSFIEKSSCKVAKNLVSTLVHEINTITSDLLPLVEETESKTVEDNKAMYDKVIIPVMASSASLVTLFQYLLTVTGDTEDSFHLAKYLK